MSRFAARGWACRVDTRDGDRAAVGLEQARDHRERGRLAGAVRADQAVERAGGDRQVDALDRARVAEALRDAADDERIAARDGGLSTSGTSSRT